MAKLVAWIVRQICASSGGGQHRGGVRSGHRSVLSGSAKAQLDKIKAFAETDFTEDLKVITVPVLVMHGGGDQIMPVDETARRAAALLPNGSLKVYDGLSHGLFATHPDLINADLLAFIEN